MYDSFIHILDSEIFGENDREYFRKIIYEEMDDITAVMAVNTLCSYLEKYYGKKVIILLDEYDTPMQESLSFAKQKPRLSGNWDETVTFFRLFFNATFKTNPYMYRSVITGITRISKESIFSDLDHLEVVTTTAHKYTTCFGFTEEEVFASLDIMGLGSEKQEVKRWHDGFTFGNDADIYNPWSITKFLNSHGEYDTYWADTSGNGLINSLLQKGSDSIKQTMEILINGGSFDVQLDEQVLFHQLDEDETAVWSLLLAAGYLCVKKMERVGKFKTKIYTLTLTNYEVLILFQKMVHGWFNRSRTVYNEFIKSLLDGNVKKMNTFMNKVALNTFSSFDAGNHPSEYSEPERLASCCDRKEAANGSSLCFSANLQREANASQFYHGFVLGLVVDLADQYQVSSNRKSGYGRYDVMIEPADKGKNAFIFEFKVQDADDDEVTLEDTANNALAQIAEKKYEAVLVKKGILPENIRKYGFAFKGKVCLIKEG